ncbi:MAG TPA: hypothetical protein PLQ77_07435 [Smithellaceae bacterium]|jgi:hypothetical protein|nr:hypothetical protein [Smithellaceae bacterium]HQJ31621.1 hypothetical protein [Syntrophales bacterium]
MTEILTTWKEIAVYLRVSVKTAKRYRKNKGLPVQRDPAGHPTLHKQSADEWKLKAKTD